MRGREYGGIVRTLLYVIVVVALIIILFRLIGSL